MPALYEQLFKDGDLSEAVRAGRRQMHAQPARVSARGRFNVHDWMLPVLYQQRPLSLELSAISRSTGSPVSTPQDALEVESSTEPADSNFIGRDGAILQLERAFRSPSAAILIHGHGGIGKTTLAKCFLEWLNDSGSTHEAVMWFSFHEEEIRTAEYVFDRIGENLYGEEFRSLQVKNKLDKLQASLLKRSLILVFDNFEVVDGGGSQPHMSPYCRRQLNGFLASLNGGNTNVLITSRSPEHCLSVTSPCS